MRPRVDTLCFLACSILERSWKSEIFCRCVTQESSDFSLCQTHQSYSQFFVKIQPDQIDDDSKAVIQGLLQEHGDELPTLMVSTQYLLVNRFYAWFLAFCTGVEAAVDASQQAASRPQQSLGGSGSRASSRPLSGASLTRPQSSGVAAARPQSNPLEE